MKRGIVFCLTLCLGLCLGACSPGPEPPVGKTDTDFTLAPDPTGETEPVSHGEYGSGLHHAEIVIKDYGTVTVELDGDTAPITVDNFCSLAQRGYYDGLTFHRIINGFMMQGGAGGNAAAIKGEFAANGVENGIRHVRGVISMARANNYDSASSQFFIMHGDAPHLDGNYAAFGRVTSGMEIVDAICENTPVTDKNGTVPLAYQPVIETVRVLD